MILLVGQVPRAFRGREAWQELDYAQVFGGIAKAAWEVDRAERMPEHIERAFRSRSPDGRDRLVPLASRGHAPEQADVKDGTPAAAPACRAGRRGSRAAARAVRAPSGRS